MPIQSLLDLLGKNASLELADVINLLQGQPVSIPVQPLTEAVAGKTLTVSLQANAIQIQLSA